MKYGYFNDEKKEYIITTPHTPTKWINYVGGLSFGGFIDHLGGSVICKGDPALNRITKYIPQLPDSSFNGETAYIKVEAENETFVFSPFVVPTGHAYDTYECRVGLGYNIYTSSYRGIEAEVTVFVPKDDEVVLRKLVVHVRRDDVKSIEITPVVEYTHFDALKQFTNADWVPQTMMSELDETCGVILKQYAFMKRDIAMNYFTTSGEVHSFETDRKGFLRDHLGGSWQNPKALWDEALSNYQARRGDNIAAVRHVYKRPSKNERLMLITQLGQSDNLKKRYEKIEAYRDEKYVDKCFDELKAFWEEYLKTIQVVTPDKGFDTMVNVHNPKQCYMTKNWSRYLSLYQLGLGARGVGIRDTSQDLMGVLPMMPDEAKVWIKILLSMQKRDGSAYHQFNPKTHIASIGDAHEDEETPDFYGDDHLWLTLVTTEYIKETGDFEFLKASVPFYDKDNHDEPLESASVEEHLIRAFEFTKHHLGQNNLPLLGFADWNDTVNLRTGAESLFNANLYGYGLKNYIGLLDHLGKDSKTHRLDYDRMKKAFQDIAWDGNWFIRYIDTDNTPLGSHENEDGKIFTNGQSWSVLSGFATPEQGRVALDSVYDILNTPNGIKLSYPGFNGYDKNKGGVSSYPPGAKENGGIFLHANPWVMYAETILGNGDRAFEYYDQINPVKKNDKLDEFESPPYVYPQNILGDEHPQFGLGRNCWLSGTASWCYQVATKNILGISADYKGLKVMPCIPKDWDGFRMIRHFRGAEYHIEVVNPERVSKGIREIYVNGQIYKGTHLPVGENEYEIKVVMGE